MTYLIETYGCQMNKAESAALEAMFRERGWSQWQPTSAALEAMFRERGWSQWQPTSAALEASAREGGVSSLQPTSTSSETEGKGRGLSASQPNPQDSLAGFAKGPDFVLVNTCSVRITAENRAWGRIDHWAAEKTRLAREGHRLVLAVTGCMAERMKKEIRVRQPAVDQVIGTFQKQAFGLVVDAAAKGIGLSEVEESPSFVFADSYHEPSSFRSFVPIMHGCNNFCTYCIVPHIRGREISRNPQSILAELEALEAQGVREVTFLGQNVNSYRWEGEGGRLDFPGLLSLVADRFRDRRGDEGPRAAVSGRDRPASLGVGEDGRAAVSGRDWPASLGVGEDGRAAVSGRDWPASLGVGEDGRAADRSRDRPASLGAGRGLRWIRFLTSHPKDLSDEALAVIAREPIFCRHIHLPVQAGSDAVLKAMNRKYDRDSYIALVERMRAALPDLSLTTDLLVGFPGETEADFEETLDLMRRVRYSYAFMYHFNSRDGTPAAKMANKVSEKDKRARLARVIELQKEISTEILRSRIGAVDEVLIEDVSRRRKSEVLARTSRDEMVVFPASASRIGSFALVRLESLVGNTFRAIEL